MLEQHPALLVAAAVDHGLQEVAPHLLRAAQQPGLLAVADPVRQLAGDEIRAGEDCSCAGWEFHRRQGRLN